MGDKPSTINKIEKIHLKCICVDGSIVMKDEKVFHFLPALLFHRDLKLSKNLLV